MNIYGLLADIIVAAHTAYLAAVVFGLLFTFLGGLLRWRWVKNFWFRFTHLSLILIVVTEALLGIVCPLTVWEYQLRVAAGQDAEGGTFVGRLLHNLIFVDASQELLTVCYCLFGALVLSSFWFVPPNRPDLFTAADSTAVGKTEKHQHSLRNAVLTIVGSAAMLVLVGLFWYPPLRELLFNRHDLTSFAVRLGMLSTFAALQCGLVVLRFFPLRSALAAVRGTTMFFFVTIFMLLTLFSPLDYGNGGSGVEMFTRFLTVFLIIATYFFTPLLNISFYLGIDFKQKPALFLYTVSQTLLITAGILYHITAGLISAAC